MNKHNFVSSLFTISLILNLFLITNYLSEINRENRLKDSNSRGIETVSENKVKNNAWVWESSYSPTSNGTYLNKDFGISFDTPIDFSVSSRNASDKDNFIGMITIGRTLNYPKTNDPYSYISGYGKYFTVAVYQTLDKIRATSYSNYYFNPKINNWVNDDGVPICHRVSDANREGWTTINLAGKKYDVFKSSLGEGGEGSFGAVINYYLMTNKGYMIVISDGFSGEDDFFNDQNNKAEIAKLNTTSKLFYEKFKINDDVQSVAIPSCVEK